MTPAQVQAAIVSSGLKDMSLTTATLCETTYRVLLKGTGSVLGKGTGSEAALIGVINADSGKLDWIFPPKNATISGLGVGSTVSAFKSRFGAAYTIKSYAGIDLRSGVRLQIQNEYSMDPTKASTLVLIAPGFHEHVGEWC